MNTQNTLTLCQIYIWELSSPHPPKKEELFLIPCFSKAALSHSTKISVGWSLITPEHWLLSGWKECKEIRKTKFKVTGVMSNTITTALSTGKLNLRIPVMQWLGGRAKGTVVYGGLPQVLLLQAAAWEGGLSEETEGRFPVGSQAGAQAGRAGYRCICCLWSPRKQACKHSCRSKKHTVAGDIFHAKFAVLCYGVPT